MPGMGTSESTKNTTQQQQTQEQGNTAQTTANNVTGATSGTTASNTNVGPWAATQPLLQNIIGSLNGASTATTQGQANALQNLEGAANGIPNFGDAASGAVGNILGGNYGGMLSGAVGNYGSSLSPYLSSSYLDPMSTPGLSDALGTMKNDITNSVNGQFAAAGRDLSPANSTALARGLTQGMAPIITNQFNQNVATQRGAQDALFGANAALPGMLTGLDSSGINLAGSIPGLYTAPGQAQLGAANAAYAQPYANTGMLEGLTTPIAQLGQSGSTSGTTAGNTTGVTTGNTTGNYSGTGSGSGTSNTTGTQTMSPLDQISKMFGIAKSFGGMLSGIPSFGGAGG